MPATAARDDHPDRATPDRPTQQHRDGDRVTDGTESACVLLCVAFGDDRGWSIYGAERSQPVATGGKWVGPENGSDERKPLPWVATSCRSERMVRRGSTVRVRQRALSDTRTARKWAGFLLPRSTPSSISLTRRGLVFVERASAGSDLVFKRPR